MGGIHRRLLWQLTFGLTLVRLYIDDETITWDATTPIPSQGQLPTRRWPAITLHDSETLDSIEKFDLPPWPETS